VIDLFDGVRESADGVELGRGDDVAAARPVEVTIAGFAAGERGGYPALALRSLREVLAGGVPEPFELRP
jgi:hypothetical protein